MPAAKRNPEQQVQDEAPRGAGALPQPAKMRRLDPQVLTAAEPQTTPRRRRNALSTEECEEGAELASLAGVPLRTRSVSGSPAAASPVGKQVSDDSSDLSDEEAMGRWITKAVRASLKDVMIMRSDRQQEGEGTSASSSSLSSSDGAADIARVQADRRRPGYGDVASVASGQVQAEERANSGDGSAGASHTFKDSCCFSYWSSAPSARRRRACRRGHC